MPRQRATAMSQWYTIGTDLRARDLLVEVPLDWSDSTARSASMGASSPTSATSSTATTSAATSGSVGSSSASSMDGPGWKRTGGGGVAATLDTRGAPRTITMYAREVVSAQNFHRYDELPLLVYLQGGPGGKSPRPLDSSGWLGYAVDKFRVILPDQRGTGRSTPLLQRDFEGRPARIGAEILACFRADSIIKDLEALREAFFPGQQWWTLGQSYGGFLTLHYLSTHPESLVGSVITGGLPSLDPDPAEVYRRTFPRIKRKNDLFYQRFPHLEERIGRIADLIDSTRPALPSGDALSVKRLQLLGLDFGMAVGFDRVHWIFDYALTASLSGEHTQSNDTQRVIHDSHRLDNVQSVAGSPKVGHCARQATEPRSGALPGSLSGSVLDSLCGGGGPGLAGAGLPEQLTDTFLHQVEAATNFGTNPLFTVLQEAIYGAGPSQWAAHQERLRHPEFDPSARPLYFTGETMFPWMFDEISTLRGFGPAVNALAEAAWPVDLYNHARLADNPVPVEAAVYLNDMYVDADLSLDTARRVKNLETLVTSEFEHDGLRIGDMGERLFERLANRLGGFVRSR